MTTLQIRAKLKLKMKWEDDYVCIWEEAMEIGEDEVGMYIVGLSVE